MSIVEQRAPLIRYRPLVEKGLLNGFSDNCKFTGSMVLVVDPDPSNQRALRDRLLRLGYSARSADDDASALEIVSSTPPDVVLVPDRPTTAKDRPSYRNSWTTGAYLSSSSPRVSAIPTPIVGRHNRAN